MAQNLANRQGDLARRQNGGRHLIEQRLKGMVIFTINQRHFDSFLAEQSCRSQSAEPAADDDDSWFWFAVIQADVLFLLPGNSALRLTPENGTRIKQMSLFHPQPASRRQLAPGVKRSNDFHAHG
jgi:hypothetical protein